MWIGSDHRHRHGATIAELLVVIGLIGVLFSIAFPALMRAKSAAGQTKSLANAQSAALAIDAYRNDHDDTYPYVHKGVPYRVSRDAEGSIANSSNEARWETRQLWWAVIADTIELNEYWESWLSPGLDPDKARVPSYYFSNSFVAASRLWTPGFDGDLSVLRPVRGAEVAFPSNKAMVWDSMLAYVHRSLVPRDGMSRFPIPIAFADLHAEPRKLIDAAEPVTNVLNSNAWADSKLHNTPNGVLGGDYGVQNR